MVESRRSSAAAKSNLVLTQSQPSFTPVPTVRPDSRASREYLSLSRSYSSRLGALRVSVLAFAFATVGGVAAFTGAFALRLTVALLLAVLSQPAINTESAANVKSPVILRLMFAKSSLHLNQTKF